MAARLETEYKQIEFDLDGVQLQEFIQLFQTNDFRTKTRIFDNGLTEDIEFIFVDQENEIPLVFRHFGSSFICEGSYKIKDAQLAQTMQKAVRQFKANALVHRIYTSYTIEYFYNLGKVMHIKEICQDKIQTIYEYHDPLQSFKNLFVQQNVELEIEQIKQEIDFWLDQRNLKKDDTRRIDSKLRGLVQKLFVLEG